VPGALVGWREEMCVGRSYDDDVRDIAAFQAGDSEAFARLLDEYDGNLKSAAGRMQHVLGFEDAYQESVVAFADWVREMPGEQSRLIRRDLGFEIHHRLQEAAYPGMNYKTVQRARSAMADLRVEAWEDTTEARPSLDEALASEYSGSRLGKESLLGMLALHRQSSLDGIMEASFDDADPYDLEGSTMYGSRLAADGDDFDPVSDPEFSGRVAASEIEAQMEPVLPESDDGRSTVADVLESLTPKQVEAVRLWLRYPGWSVRQIALDNDMVPRTLERILARAFDELRVNVRIQSLVEGDDEFSDGGDCDA